MNSTFLGIRLQGTYTEKSLLAWERIVASSNGYVRNGV